MSQQQDQILIDHLDSLLAGNPSPVTEQLIAGDKELAKEWQSLLFAVDAIREAGNREKVTAARRQHEKDNAFVRIPAGGGVRRIYRNVFRVAACLLLIIGATAIYKYSTVNPGSIYNDYYSSYELSTTRGSETNDALEQAFRAGNWQEVITRFKAQITKPTKSYFLAGTASLELKKYNDAVNAFKQVLDSNSKSGDNYFQDESEYYLAMSYLASNQSAEALPLIEKIRADKNHLYHQKIKGISGIDLEILDYKAGK